MLREFREFALKGNMVDLAIGVIIGSSFGGLVTSLVKDLFMPLVGVVTGGIDFTNMYLQITGTPQDTLDAARTAGATVAYGNFITLAINFLIVALVLFVVARAMNQLRRKSPEPAAEPVAPPAELVLLREIRDLLALTAQRKA